MSEHDTLPYLQMAGSEEADGTELALVTRALNDVADKANAATEQVNDFVRQLSVRWTADEILALHYATKGGPAVVTVNPTVVWQLCTRMPNPQKAAVEASRVAALYGGSFPLYALTNALMGAGFGAAMPQRSRTVWR